MAEPGAGPVPPDGAWWRVALIPAGAGIVAAAGLLLIDPGIAVRVTMKPAFVVLLAGVLITAGWLGAGALIRRNRRRTALAVAAAAEQAHAQARAEHRRFLGRLDHELKNPVTAIRAAIAAHADAGQPPLRTADEQAARLAVVVTDLRKLAELQTSELEREQVDLHALVEDVVATLRGELAVAGELRDLRISFPQAPWRVPPVVGDSDLLFLALYNVLSNARKFTVDGDLIEIRAGDGDGFVDIDIADTGRGIPEEDVAAVWEELSRASNARSVPGSGLGMTMVRTVVERHGGRVQLRSRLGEGTSVRLSLPTVPTP